MVGMTVGFTKTNRHPLVVLYEGRNAVGFLSIFCTNQPVGIGLVDSWTSPRGNDSQKVTIVYLSCNGSNKVATEFLNQQTTEFKSIRPLKFDIMSNFGSSVWLFVGSATITTLPNRKLSVAFRLDFWLLVASRIVFGLILSENNGRTQDILWLHRSARVLFTSKLST